VGKGGTPILSHNSMIDDCGEMDLREDVIVAPYGLHESVITLMLCLCEKEVFVFVLILGFFVHSRVTKCCSNNGYGYKQKKYNTNCDV
jgi:hypothetical protein